MPLRARADKEREPPQPLPPGRLLRKPTRPLTAPATPPPPSPHPAQPAGAGRRVPLRERKRRRLPDAASNGCAPRLHPSAGGGECARPAPAWDRAGREGAELNAGTVISFLIAFSSLFPPSFFGRSALLSRCPPFGRERPAPRAARG